MIMDYTLWGLKNGLAETLSYQDQMFYTLKIHSLQTQKAIKCLYRAHLFPVLDTANWKPPQHLLSSLKENITAIKISKLIIMLF